MSGTATFDLSLGCPDYGGPTDEDIQLFINSVDKSWFSRCRSLTLWAPEEHCEAPNTRTLGDLLQRYSYDLLEVLWLEHTGTKMWPHMLEALMDRVEHTSPNLQSLTVVCDSAVKETANNVLQRPRVLGRIQTLDIRRIGQPIPWSNFENLQELKIYDEKEANLLDLTNLTAPVLTRLLLEGNFRPHGIPLGILPQLTHFTLVCFRFDAQVSTGKPLSLPSLISLTFIDTVFELASLDAPKLENFIFQIEPYDQSPYIYPLSQGSTSSPRVIRLDILSYDKTDEHFNDPLPFWSRVEELHVTTFKGVRFTKTKFMETLCGGRSDQMFPTLRRLSVLHPSDCPDGGPSFDEKEVRMDEARGIIEARVAGRLGPFEQLEVGWYWTNNNTNVLEDHSREWWVTAWEDCCSRTS